MRRKVLVPCCILLISRELLGSIACPSILLDWKVALIGDGDTRKLVFAFLTGIEGEDLILFVLVRAQVKVVLNGAIRKLTSSQISPPSSVPSSFMKSIPAASRLSGRGYSFLCRQLPGKSARFEIVSRTVPSVSMTLMRRTAMVPNAWLRLAVAPLRTVMAKARVRTPRVNSQESWA